MTMPLDLLKDHEVAAGHLAQYLRDGSLVLIIGAGASKGVGLPLWWELVSRGMGGLGLDPTGVGPTTPNEELRKLMERVEKAAGSFDIYREVVKKSLYGDIDYSENLIGERLLVAFGALLMGSRRGKIRTVINFNFDDVLEWYLALHGFETQVISRVPVLTKEVDALVYHPHGFLPKYLSDDQASDFLVLSQYSYDERLGNEKDPWIRFTKEILLSKIGLFVGLSGRDPVFGPLLADVKSTLRSMTGHDRPTGFWLFGSDGEDHSDLERRNVVPLVFPNHDRIPLFLLKICQLAAST